MPKLKPNTTMTFAGYAEELADGQDEILKKGEAVVVQKYNADDDSYTVSAVDDPDRADTVFLEELSEPVAAPARSRRAKASVKADPEPVEVDDDETDDDETDDDETDDEAGVTPAEINGMKKSEVLKLAGDEGITLTSTKILDMRAELIAEMFGDADQDEDEDEDEDEEPVAAPAPKRARASAGGKKPQGTAKAKGTTRAKAKATDSKAKATGGKTVAVLPMVKDMVAERETAIASAKKLAEQLAAVGEQENELREQSEEAKLMLGGTLLWIKQNDAYKDEGFETFDEFCEGTLGLKPRACHYYIRTHETCLEAGITEAQIKGIGFTKLRELIGVVTKENKKDLLASAREMKRDDFAAHVREVKKGKASPSDPNATKFVKFPAFRVFDDRAEVLNTAIDAAKKTFSVDNMSDALVNIASEWLGSQDADVSLEDALAALNARYGTNYTVDDEDDFDEDEDEDQDQD